MILLSLLSGIIFNYIYLKSKNIENEHILLFSSMIALFSIIGGNMINLFLGNKQVQNNVLNLSSYGGAIGVIIASMVFEKINPKDRIFIKSGMISLPLIYSISKLGCFFAGCCYGLPCNSILCVTYASGLNISLIPIQLIETIVFMMIFIVCVCLKNNKNIIGITIMISSFCKFALDFFRYNHLEEIISKNQIISIIFFIIGIIMIKKDKIKLCSKQCSQSKLQKRNRI